LEKDKRQKEKDKSVPEGQKKTKDKRQKIKMLQKRKPIANCPSA
jgi:hypothetical protein